MATNPLPGPSADPRPAPPSKADPTINPESVPAGGKNCPAPPGAASGKDTGCGSVGNSSKPYKLKG